jgi:hypothetical protein
MYHELLSGALGVVSGTEAAQLMCCGEAIGKDRMAKRIQQWRGHSPEPNVR